MAACLAALAFALYLPGINWGLPAVVSWSQDTIAGVRTLGAVETWPSRWAGRYPPLQYFLVRAAYQPVLSHWERNGQAVVDPQSGRLNFAPPHAPKIGRLILIARIMTAVMGVAAVLALWHAARILTGDELSAALAALSFASGAGFVYFAHLGNVDVPSIFWFALSLIFYARSLRTRAARDAILLGLFGSLCISTKDNWAGIYPGMAVALLVAEWPARQTESATRQAIAAVLQWRWLLGAVAFVLPYTILNGIFADPRRWLDRLRSLADTLEKNEFRQPTHFHLFGETVVQSATAVGWPMIAAMAAAVGYSVLRLLIRPARMSDSEQSRSIPRQLPSAPTIAGLNPTVSITTLAFVLLVPCLSYYLIVIARIGFVYERFLFAPLALMCVLVGAAGSALIRTDRQSRFEAGDARRIVPAIRFGVPVGILLFTLGNAVAVNLEMLADSRYAAERWFVENVADDATLGAMTDDLQHFSPQYLPRVHELGYATYPVLAALESFDQPQPDYLILSSFDADDFDAAARDCLEPLLAGRLGYKPVVEFRGRYLGFGKSWLSIAGWFAPPPGKISPTVTVLQHVSK